MKSITVKSKPEVCPNCGFKPVGKILYGMPAYSQELERDLSSGITVLGGCCVFDGQPVWACKNCGCEFYKEVSKIV